MLGAMIAGRVFDPRRIATLETWYDAADSASITLDSSRVSQWNDKSGNGRHVSNTSSGSTQPSYITAAKAGLNAVRFAAGSSQRLVASTASDWTWLHDGTKWTAFIVATAPVNASGLISTLTAYESSTSLGCELNFASLQRMRATVTNGSGTLVINENINTGLIASGAYGILQFRLDPSNATAASRAFLSISSDTDLSTGGIASGTPSSSSPNAALNIGRNAAPTTYYTGDICEILLYKSQLGTAERQAVRLYLGAKWNITTT